MRSQVEIGTGSQSGCGCADEAAALPELDVRPIPHLIRHGAVFGALESLPPGTGMVLVAHHDPVPLLRQIEERAPGGFAVEYVESGPEEWRISFTRVG
ncbi:hypothetical protein CZ771_03890 [Actinomycetales bacterium JB111]|nr:hypothetical protein CZ771_03890 [Actinomycetales bacterium JB111]